jgi:hypothetical protein
VVKAAELSAHSSLGARTRPLAACNDCVKVRGREGEGSGRAGGPCLRGSRGAECAADPRLLRPCGLAADATFPYRSPER